MAMSKPTRIIVMAAALALPAAARKPGEPIKPGFNLFSKQQDIQLGVQAASEVRKQYPVVPNPGLQDYLPRLGRRLGATAYLLKFSRGAESEADALGTRIMNDAGYNPIEMARFFEKLQAEDGSRAPQFLSDHPNPGNRVKAVEAEIRALPQHPYGTAV